MNKIKAWIIPTQGEIITEELPANAALERARKIIGDWTDLTKVKWNGKLCHMAVDDMGYHKRLPVNHIATRAYWDNCIPGTTHPIVGTAVIFDGMLD
jgi:hypothetical protein